MVATPKKIMAGVLEGTQARLSEPVRVACVFMPRSPLLPGQSERDARRLAKQPVAVAVTPTRIHVFSYKTGAYTGKVRILDELVSWPRQGVRLVRGQGAQPLQVGVAGTVESATINLAQNTIGLQFPDGAAVRFGYTPLGQTMRDVADAFVAELGGDQPSPETPTGPAFTP